MLRRRAWIVLPARTASQTTAKPALTIRPAIHRSPTAVLEALSSTVGVDVTAPHFQFIDDPATIPTTVASKKVYLMAKELGKRAARQLAAEWPTLFAFDRDQPRLPAFRLQKPLDPLQMELTEENLRVLIEKRAVKDACMFYERLRAEEREISEDTSDELLNLAAYYNGEDPPFAEHPEWHALRYLAVENTKEWTSGGVADLLYETLPKTALRRSTMVAALCKHSSEASVQRARNIFQEMRTEGQKASTEAFAGLIHHSNWKTAQQLLVEMNKSGVMPTEDIWYAVAEITTRSSQARSLSQRITMGRSIQAEAAACGGEPRSLRVYDAVLRSLQGQPDKAGDDNHHISASVAVLQEMLTELESRPTILRSGLADGGFFLTGMSISALAGQLPLGRRLVSLYESSANQVRLPSIGSEGSFYTSFVMLAAARDPSAESFRTLYISQIPRLVGMSRVLALAVTDRLKSLPDWPLLLRLTEDCIAARLSVDFRVIGAIRMLLIDTPFQSLAPSERQDYSFLVSRMVSVAVELSRFTDPRQKRLQHKLAPMTICELALLLNRTGETERAWQLLNLLLDESATDENTGTVTPSGYGRLNMLGELFDDAIRRGDSLGAATCLEIMANQLPRQKLELLAQRLIDRCQLSESQIRIVRSFVRLKPQ